MKNKKILSIVTIAILIIAVAIIATTFNINKETAFANTAVANKPYYYWGGSSNAPTSGQPTSASGNTSGSAEFTNMVITAETNQEINTVTYITLYWLKQYTTNNKTVQYTIYNGTSNATSDRYIKWKWTQTGNTTFNKYLYFGKRVEGNWQETQLTTGTNRLLIKFSSNDPTLSNGSNYGEIFMNDIMPTLSSAYNVVNNCQNLSVYPSMIAPPPGATSVQTIIYLNPDNGYKLPDGNDFNDFIQFQYTALDGVYYPEYSQFIVTNLSSDFTITGSLPRDITEYNVTWNITNGNGSPNTIIENDINTITITPNSGYNYPDTINYTGTADDIEYYNDTGDIVITNPTSDFTITAICDPANYNLKAGYYIPDIRAIENIADYGTYVMIDLPHYISKVTGQIVTAEPDNSSYRYNILDNNFAESDARDGILFDLSAQNLGISAVTGQSGSITVNEHIVVYDALNNSFAYSNFYLLHVPNDTSIPYDYKDFFIDMGNYITYYALPTSIYTDGVTAGENTSILGGNTTGLISQIFNALFGTIFAVEIFPGFPLYIFILIPVVFGIIGILLWLIRGK